MVREIFGGIAFARKISDGPGVLVQRLSGVERAQPVARLCNTLPMCALGTGDSGARTGSKLAKIFGAHAAS